MESMATACGSSAPPTGMRSGASHARSSRSRASVRKRRPPATCCSYCLADSYERPTYRFFACSMLAAYTFSSSSSIGCGHLSVTASAIARPTAKASATDRPSSSTNIESVSPYTTRARHSRRWCTISIAASRISLPVCTMASAR